MTVKKGRGSRLERQMLAKRARRSPEARRELLMRTHGAAATTLLRTLDDPDAVVVFTELEIELEASEVLVRSEGGEVLVVSHKTAESIYGAPLDRDQLSQGWRFALVVLSDGSVRPSHFAEETT